MHSGSRAGRGQGEHAEQELLSGGFREDRVGLIELFDDIGPVDIGLEATWNRRKRCISHQGHISLRNLHQTLTMEANPRTTP